MQPLYFTCSIDLYKLFDRRFLDKLNESTAPALAFQQFIGLDCSNSETTILAINPSRESEKLQVTWGLANYRPAITIALSDQGVLISGDPDSHIPLYFTMRNDKFLISTDILSLTSLLPSLNLNFNGLTEILSPFWSVHNETIFEGVYTLPSGYEIQVIEKQFLLRVKQPLQLEEIQNRASTVRNVDQAVQVFQEILQSEISKRFSSCSNLGLISGLSGGKDSAAVAHEIRRTLKPHQLGRGYSTASILLSGSQSKSQSTRVNDLITFLRPHDAYFVDLDDYLPFSNKVAPPFKEWRTPYLDFYWEATAALLARIPLGVNGPQIFTTGFGGDELFSVESPTEVAERRNGDLSNEQFPSFFTSKLISGIKELPYLKNDYLPLGAEEIVPSSIFHSYRQIQRIYNPIVLARGLYPIAPLGFPEIVAFMRSIPREFCNRELFWRTYQSKNNFPLSSYNFLGNDSFAEFFTQGLIQRFENSHGKLFENNILVRKGFLNGNLLAKLTATSLAKLPEEEHYSLGVAILIDDFLKFTSYKGELDDEDHGGDFVANY